MDKKVAFIDQIKRKKSIIESKFSDKVTQEEKNKAWGELLVFAKSIELVPESCTKEKLRDQTWANWKRRAKDKFDRRRRTGEGKIKMSLLDDAVLDVIGKESPVVVGLVVSDEENDAVELQEKEQEEREEPKTQNDDEQNEPTVPDVATCSTQSRKRHVSSKKDVQDDLEVQKKRAQIEYIKASAALTRIKAYKTRLKCLKLEKELQITAPQALTIGINDN